MSEPIKVLLASDHPVVRLGLANHLRVQKDIQIVGEASSPLDALKKAVEFKPDFIIMDVTTPELNWPQNVVSIGDRLKGAWASLPNNFTIVQVLNMLRSKVSG